MGLLSDCLIADFMKKTGNAMVDDFLAELDRRIDSPDSPHDEASKDRLRKMRVGLQILAAGEPERFAVICKDYFQKLSK